MKISKKSWHYKLTNFIWVNTWINNMSLCKYFWMVVLSILASPILITFAIIVTPFIIVIFPFAMLKKYIEDWYFRREYRKKQEEGEQIKPPEPSLLTAYLKATKDKVCPLIEFED